MTVIADCAVGATAPASLLSLPLGTGTILDHLVSIASRIGSKEIYVRTALDNGLSLERNSFDQRNNLICETVTSQQLRRKIDDLEPSDLLLIIDPRYWPARGQNFDSAIRSLDGYPGAVHGIAVGTDVTGATERVQCDSNGRVQRIRRLYHRVTHAERVGGIVAYSIVPVSSMHGVEFDTLSELRLKLSAKGVLSRDIPLDSDVIELTKERGYLALSEQVIHQVVQGNMPEAYSRLTSDILVGRGALIHDTARIVGPVIVQPGATIERQATIIGPALIAGGSAIRAGAVVAQSIVPFDAIVKAGATVRHCAAPQFVEKTARAEGQDYSSVEDDLDDVGSDIVVAPDLHETMMPQTRYARFKRGIELTMAILLLVILTPLFLIVAILIKVNSRGPVFFVHHREGLGGRRFPCFKFRTMSQDSHHLQRKMYQASMVDGPHFKMKNDPRVTRVGKFLRRMNIDELPQIINVILGHMSLVGPRPSPFRENQFCVPWRRARLSVRPGITGLWQICRSYGSDSDFQQWIYYDILYVRHMSAWLDIKIIFATVFALMSDRSISLSWLIPGEAPPPAITADKGPIHTAVGM